MRNSHRWVSSVKELIPFVVEIIPVDFFYGPNINLGNICSGQPFRTKQYFNILKKLQHFIVKAAGKEPSSLMPICPENT